MTDAWVLRLERMTQVMSLDSGLAHCIQTYLFQWLDVPISTPILPCCYQTAYSLPQTFLMPWADSLPNHGVSPCANSLPTFIQIIASCCVWLHRVKGSQDKRQLCQIKLKTFYWIPGPNNIILPYDQELFDSIEIYRRVVGSYFSENASHIL